MMKNNQPLFRRGDHVEVLSDEVGFQGSHWEAMVVQYLGSNQYKVEYTNLITEEGSTELLTDTVGGKMIRPYPPRIRFGKGFKMREVVDVWDKDGWWVGRVTGRAQEGLMYYVYFDQPYEQEIAYPVSMIRPHLDWVDGTWIQHSVIRRSKNMLLG